MFKVGDKVWSVANGWGEVFKITDGTYPVRVKYKHTSVTYTAEGKRYYNDESRCLFFEEIPIPETALVRPRWKSRNGGRYYYVAGDGEVAESTEHCCITDNRRYEHGNYFQTEKDAMESKFYKIFHEEVK